jgi:hypothetical protein
MTFRMFLYKVLNFFLSFVCLEIVFLWIGVLALWRFQACPEIFTLWNPKVNLDIYRVKPCKILHAKLFNFSVKHLLEPTYFQLSFQLSPARLFVRSSVLCSLGSFFVVPLLLLGMSFDIPFGSTLLGALRCVVSLSVHLLPTGFSAVYCPSLSTEFHYLLSFQYFMPISLTALHYCLYMPLLSHYCNCGSSGWSHLLSPWPSVNPLLPSLMEPFKCCLQHSACSPVRCSLTEFEDGTPNLQCSQWISVLPWNSI